MPISTIGQNGLNAPLSLTSPALTTPNLGTPSAINLSNATSLAKAALPTGSVLQVVSTYNTNTVSATSGLSMVPLSITLSSASNKVLVCASCSVERAGGSAGNYIYVYPRRNSSVILGNSGSILNAAGYQTTTGMRQGGSIQYLDSPASTSTLTYDIFQDFANGGGAQFLFYGLNLTLMEIAA
jgi:hypothetical protein